MIESSQKIVVTGIIVPNNWDDNGKVIELALYTNKEADYVVEDSSSTPELISLLQKKVEIKGKIGKHPAGAKSITVLNYFVLEDIIDDVEKTI